MPAGMAQWAMAEKAAARGGGSVLSLYLADWDCEVFASVDLRSHGGVA